MSTEKGIERVIEGLYCASQAVWAPVSRQVLCERLQLAPTPEAKADVVLTIIQELCDSNQMYHKMANRSRLYTCDRCGNSDYLD